MGYRQNAPYFLNTIPVKLAILNRDTALLDPDFDEPLDTKQYTTVLFNAQLRMNVEQKLQDNAGGNVPQAAGYLIFKLLDLEDASLVIQTGDKLIGLGNRSGTYDDVSFTFVDVKRVGHFGGRPLLLHCDFEDDRAARQPLSRSITS